jgi:hypothetical protein
LRRRCEQRGLYAGRVARRQAIAEHHRKVRHFFLGLGAVLGVGILTGITVVKHWHSPPGNARR